MSVHLFDLDTASTPPLLDELSWNFRSSRVLHVANNLDLFTRLADGPMTAEALAKACGTDPTMTERLLICCCALGFLCRDEGRYRNSQIADTYLVRGRPLYQGDWLGLSQNMLDFWIKLDAVVYTGRRDATPEDLPDHARRDHHQDFIRAMHNLSVTGTAQMVARNVDLTGAKRLLDVGGGPGTYTIAFCQRYPELTAVILDKEETLRITREYIAAFEMEGRIVPEVGDWLQESYGDDYDAVLFSNVLHGPSSQAPEKLARAHAALNPGGTVIVHDFLLNNEKTGPLAAALFHLMVEVYTIGEMLEVVEAAGFEEVQLVAFGNRGNGLVVGRKPQS